MSNEIIMGAEWEIGAEILDFADAGDAWCETGLEDRYNLVNEVLYNCPSIWVESECCDCGMLSHVAYTVTTDDPVQARQEIRDRIAAMLRQRRRKDQAKRRAMEATPPAQRNELFAEEIATIAREVCEPGDAPSVIDGFKDWDAIEVDAFGRNCRRSMPKKAESVDSVRVWVEIDSFDETIYFHRTRTRDEIWVSSAYTSGRIVTAPRHGRKAHAKLRVMAVYVLSRAGLAWNGGISDRSLQIVQATIEHYLDESREKAKTRGADSMIVKTADELGLHPEPRPGATSTWQASCPSGNHFIDISAESNNWFCGYCKVQGGPMELREFVASRRGE